MARRRSSLSTGISLRRTLWQTNPEADAPPCRISFYSVLFRLSTAKAHSPRRPRGGETSRTGLATTGKLDQSQPRNPWFRAQLGTIADDNQPNTYPEVRLHRGGGLGVISDWDETVAGFEKQHFFRKPKYNPHRGGRR